MLSGKLGSSLFHVGSRRKDEPNKVLSTRTAFPQYGAAYEYGSKLGEPKTTPTRMTTKTTTEENAHAQLHSSAKNQNHPSMMKDMLEERDQQEQEVLYPNRNRSRNRETGNGMERIRERRQFASNSPYPERREFSSSAGAQRQRSIDENIRTTPDDYIQFDRSISASADMSYDASCDGSVYSSSTSCTEFFHSSAFDSSLSCDKSVAESIADRSVCEDERSEKLMSSIASSVKHVRRRSELKSRREKARMKYQQILLAGASPSSSPKSRNSKNLDLSNKKLDNTHHLSTVGEHSSSKVKKRHSTRPRRIQRECSEIEEDLDSFSHKAEAVSSHRIMPSIMGSTWLSLENLGVKKYSSDGVIAKKKPYIKRYAEEYNMLVSSVVGRNSSSEKISADASNQSNAVIKVGVLKRMTHMDIGLGVDVCVELRPGMMTYYDDVDDEMKSLEVKSIPIHGDSCECQPMKRLQRLPFPGWNSVFVVSINNFPTQYWMAESEGERNSWIEAFFVAMSSDQDCREGTDVESVSREKNCKKESQAHRNADILLYLHVRGLIRGSSLKGQYMDAVSMLMGKSMCVSISWLKKYFDDAISLRPENGAPLEIIDNESLSINSRIVKGGIESVMVVLKSYIQDLDRVSTCRTCKSDRIKESKTVFFARDILVKCDRNESEDESRYCIDKLLGNSKLALITKGSAELEPIKISLRALSKDEEVFTDDGYTKKRRDGGSRYTVEVTIAFTNIYRICNPIIGRREETWALVRTNFLRKLALSPDSMEETGQFIQFDIMPV